MRKKALSARRACMPFLAAAAFTLATAHARALDDAIRLRDIIDRAAERESAMDGVQAGFRMETAFSRLPRAGAPRGGDSGAAGRGRDGARVQRRRGTGAAARAGRRGGGTAIIEGTWAASGVNAAFDGTITRASAAGASTGIRMVTNGDVSKGLFATDDSTRGFVTSGAGPMARMAFMTPDRLGVTALPFSTASLSAMLAGESSTFTFGRGDRKREIEITRTTRLVGTEMVDGREVVVVEVEESFGRRGTLRRLYFDKTLNYACVCAEQGRMVEGEFRARSRWRFEDFREVKPGLFVPFCAVSERTGPEAMPVPTMTYTLLSLEFPGFFEEGLFELQFPEGTEVRDGIADLSYTIGELPFDGMDLLLDEIDEAGEAAFEAERAPALDAAPAPALDAAPAPPEDSRRIALLSICALIATCAAAVLAAGFAVICRKRRRPPPA